MARENKDKKDELDELSNAIGNMFDSLQIEEAGQSFKPPKEEEIDETPISFGPQEIKKHSVEPPKGSTPPPPVTRAPNVGFEELKLTVKNEVSEPPQPVSSKEIEKEKPKIIKSKPKLTKTDDTPKKTPTPQVTPIEPLLPEEAPHAMDIGELLAGYEKDTLQKALKQAEEFVQIPPPSSEKSIPASPPKAPVKKIESKPIEAPAKLEPPRQATVPPPASSSMRGGFSPLFARGVDTIKPSIKGQESAPSIPPAPVSRPQIVEEKPLDRIKKIERSPEASEEEKRKVRLRAELEELKREILAEQQPDQEIVTKTETGIEFTDKFKDFSARSEFKAKNFYQKAMPVMIIIAAAAILYFVYQLNPGIKDSVNSMLSGVFNYIRLGFDRLGG